MHENENQDTEAMEVQRLIEKNQREEEELKKKASETIENNKIQKIKLEGNG